MFLNKRIRSTTSNGGFFNLPIQISSSCIIHKWHVRLALKNQSAKKQKFEILVMTPTNCNDPEATSLHDVSRSVNVTLKLINSKTHAKGKKTRVLA